MGKKEEEFSMYSYVDKKLVAGYRPRCEELLREMQKRIRQKHKITMRVVLIGSGARDLVTRNADEPFDLDYNLVLQKCPDIYKNNPKKLKDTIRSVTDEVFKEDFSYGGDSVHAIRYKKTEGEKVVFRLDIAIHLSGPSEATFRLARNKENSSWYWEPRRSSFYGKEKASLAKRKGLWPELKRIYLEKKNMHLSRQDYDIPSSSIYLEALNEVLQKNG